MQTPNLKKYFALAVAASLLWTGAGRLSFDALWSPAPATQR